MNVKNKLFEAAVECSSDAIIGLNKSGKIVTFNSMAERVFAIDRAGVTGKKYSSVISGEEIKQFIDDIYRSAEPSSAEKLLCLNGENYYSVFLAPLLKQSKLGGLIIIMRDLTHLKNIEKGMTEFVGNVSHEFRTPLTSIKGFVETLLEGALTDTEVCRRFLQVINEETNRLVRLTVSLLAVTSSFAGEKQEQIKYELVSISDIIDNAMDVLSTFAQKYSLEFEVSCPPDISLVYVNPDKIKQVFINLIDNAIKYTGLTGKGKITVTVCEFDEYLEISIKDTGVGIPKSDLDKVFQRFYRVDRGYSQEVGGTGIGLAITKNIVESFGGEIRVESEVGKGSNFIFTIMKSSPMI